MRRPDRFRPGKVYPAFLIESNNPDVILTLPFGAGRAGKIQVRKALKCLIAQKKGGPSPLFQLLKG